MGASKEKVLIISEEVHKPLRQIKWMFGIPLSKSGDMLLRLALKNSEMVKKMIEQLIIDPIEREKVKLFFVREYGLKFNE